MSPEEIDAIASALGYAVTGVRTLAGGFSHETCLLEFELGRAVARLGGADPAIEAAVMAKARGCVPVPAVLCVLPAQVPAQGGDEPATRPSMVLEYVTGTLLSEVLSSVGEADEANQADFGELGTEVGRAFAAVGAVTFGRPGFFVDADLAVGEMPPWSSQLTEMAETCMASVPAARLDPATRQAWIALCAAHAPALARVDDQARLVHADANPKNVLVSRVRGGWRVAAVLDWEFSFSGCPYTDFANMMRLSGDYPVAFVDGFRSGFAAGLPADLARDEDWPYLGRVMDMFALSDLVTRPLGHPVAAQAAAEIRRWLTHGIPDAPA